MKKTALQYADQIMPYIQSINFDSANAKFKDDSTMSSYPNMKVLNAFKAEIETFTEEELKELCIEAKEAKSTVPYPYTKQALTEIANTCAIELRLRKNAEAALLR